MTLHALTGHSADPSRPFAIDHICSLWPARHIKVTVGEKDTVVGRVGGIIVPRYVFVVQRADQKEELDPHSMILPNNRAALHHAERTITELQKKKGYRDPRVLLS